MDGGADVRVQWSMTPKRIKLGIGLAATGWLLAAVPLLVFAGYAGTVGQCVSAGTSTRECGSSTSVMAAMACLAAGPAFLGIAVATNRAWAWLVTALLAVPVAFVGYDFLTFTYL